MRKILTSSPSRLLTIALIMALAALGAASAQTYGTVVDEAWYDMVAEAYQNPPVLAGRYELWMTPTWPFEDRYAPIRLDRSVSSDGVPTFTPRVESHDCVLYGTASLAEVLMRSWSSRLGNLTGGPGAAEFKEELLAFASLDIVGFESAGANDAAVLHNGIRYPAIPNALVPTVGGRLPGSYSYFSVADLRQAGAIVDGTITVVTGHGAGNTCVFNLNDLP